MAHATLDQPQKRRSHPLRGQRNLERNQNIVRMAIHEGIPLMEIASTFNLHVSTVRLVIWKAGHSTKGLDRDYRTKSALSTTEIRRRDECIADLRRGGATLQSIGDQYNISRERVRQICRRMGVEAEEADAEAEGE